MNKEILQKLINSGHSSRKISEILNVSRSNISYWIDKYGLETKFHRNKKGSVINWMEIQKYYDNGNSESDITTEFGISSSTINRAVKRGDIKVRTISEGVKIIKKTKPQKHSSETKNKISEIRKKYLKENPDKVPYLLNHYSKGASYPERYFCDLFEIEGIILEKQYRVGTYSLDFAQVERKIDIEIDGSQHKNDPKVVLHDIKRNNALTKMGWRVYRVYWPEYQKKSREDKEKTILEIKEVLDMKV